MVLLALGGCAFESSVRSPADAKAEIIALEKKLVGAKNVDAVMELFCPDVETYDIWPPLRYKGAEHVREDFAYFFANFTDVEVDILELDVDVDRNLAIARSLQRQSATPKDGKPPVRLMVRVTDGLRRVEGKWCIFHEHLSVPVDIHTGVADLNAKP
jgi:ketosteroid isomerase-like protein